MIRPLQIRNLENISLEASNDKSDLPPQLVAQFTCQYVTDNDCIHILHDKPRIVIINPCCSAILMFNVTHAVLEGIRITTETPNVSAIILQQCSHLHIQSLAFNTIHNVHTDSNDFDSEIGHKYEIGIVAYESNDIEMGSLKANNFTTGVVLYNSSSTKMINVSAVNHLNGIYLLYCTATSMMDISAVHNVNFGIRLSHSNDSSLINITALYNKRDGIVLSYSTSTRMTNVYALQNAFYGINVWQSSKTSMINVSSIQNKNNGITMQKCSGIIMINISAVQNKKIGIEIVISTDINITNVSILENKIDGLYLYYSSDTNMKTVSAALQNNDGIVIYASKNTSFMNVSAVRNRNIGIKIDFNSRNTSLYNTYTCHNEIGIMIMASITTYIVYHNSGNNILYLQKSADSDNNMWESVLGKNTDIKMTNSKNIYITNTSSPITAYNTKNIIVNDSIFHNMDVQSTVSSTSEPTSLPAVITVYESTLTITDCTFTGNKMSSIKAFSSNLTLSGKVLFHNNIALSGTALIFAKNSLLIITDSSNIHFQNNHAINYGGVLYISTEESYETSMTLQDITEFNGGGSLLASRTECFVHVEGSRSHARLTFINNTAGKGGDVLYGGLVALGYDGDWNCLHSFKNVSNMSQQSGLSLISSAPSRVCLCNETGQPDCLTVADPEPLVIYPGQTISIPAVVTGQDFGTTTGSVFAQFLRTPHTTDFIDMEPRHSIAVKHSQCSDLEYTIFSQGEEFEAVLVLTADNKEISHIMNKEDNQEVTNTWETLSKEPNNYKTLARDIICDFINFTVRPPKFTIKFNESDQPGNRTIENFYKFTPAPVEMHNKYCSSTFIPTKFVFPEEIYSYPAYINVSFRPCPLGFSLSKHPPFRCDCNQLIIQLPGVKCHIQNETISRCGLVWISIVMAMKLWLHPTVHTTIATEKKFILL